MPILGVSLAVRSIPKINTMKKINTWGRKGRPFPFVLHFEMFWGLRRRCTAEELSLEAECPGNQVMGFSL